VSVQSGDVVVDPQGPHDVPLDQQRRRQQLAVDEAAVLGGPPGDLVDLIPLLPGSATVDDRFLMKLVGPGDQVVEVPTDGLIGRVPNSRSAAGFQATTVASRSLITVAVGVIRSSGSRWRRCSSRRPSARFPNASLLQWNMR
jgi:hypothetical protein